MHLNEFKHIWIHLNGFKIWYNFDRAFLGLYVTYRFGSILQRKLLKQELWKVLKLFRELPMGWDIGSQLWSDVSRPICDVQIRFNTPKKALEARIIKSIETFLRVAYGLRYRRSTLIARISAYMWCTDSVQYSNESSWSEDCKTYWNFSESFLWTEILPIKVE